MAPILDLVYYLVIKHVFHRNNNNDSTISRLIHKCQYHITKMFNYSDTTYRKVYTTIGTSCIKVAKLR